MNDAELVSILGDACGPNCSCCLESDDDVDARNVMEATPADAQSQFALELDLELIEND